MSNEKAGLERVMICAAQAWLCRFAQKRENTGKNGRCESIKLSPFANRLDTNFSFYWSFLRLNCSCSAALGLTGKSGAVKILVANHRGVEAVSLQDCP